ncbi:hypothetical protein DFH09DRAFT_1111304 [Mycena vulgaris]|nr:hypothetical protein DFH09DRAFT_1111304 [Mycena vulgaris]
MCSPSLCTLKSADPSLRIFIAALPPVLMLHVKRFCASSSSPNLLASKAATTGRKPFGTSSLRRCTITACPRRAGTTRSTCCTARRAALGARWVRIDDERVSDVCAKDVFGVEREREEWRSCAHAAASNTAVNDGLRPSILMGQYR